MLIDQDFRITSFLNTFNNASTITSLLLSDENKRMNKVSFDFTICYCKFNRVK